MSSPARRALIEYPGVVSKATEGSGRREVVAVPFVTDVEKLGTHQSSANSTAAQGWAAVEPDWVKFS